MGINWGMSYSSKWRLRRVNMETWEDAEDYTKFVQAMSISKDSTDDVPLLETASAVMDVAFANDLPDGYYRIEALISQPPNYERIPLATILFEKSSDNIIEGMSVQSWEGRSVLRPAADITCLAGTYAPKGCNGAFWVRDRLSECLAAPVDVVGDGFTLDDPISFSGGTSYLSMCWAVLDKGKWCLQISGYGEVSVMPLPKEPSITFSRKAMKYLKPELNRTRNLIDIPNRYIGIFEDFTEIAENRNPDSEASYENRGRWVDYYDSSPKRVNGESAYAYVRRRLEEESTRIIQWSYTREYLPGLLPFDLIEAALPNYDFTGTMRVLSQKYTLDKGITVSETCGVERKEFTA